MKIYKIMLSTTAAENYGIDREAPITVVMVGWDGEFLDSFPYDNLADAVQDTKNNAEPGDDIQFM